MLRFNIILSDFIYFVSIELGKNFLSSNKFIHSINIVNDYIKI